MRSALLAAGACLASLSAALPTLNLARQASPALPPVFRGVNLGGWLVLEKWMTPEVFQGQFSDAVDQWTFDQKPGAKEALEKHWSTYITRDDINTIAGWGINAVRIPIGYWAYQNNVGAPFISGADKYLDLAIGWCREKNIKVLIDLHGVPGGQNGFDNSGQKDAVNWQKGNNMDETNNVLRQMAEKYGTAAYADTVFGIQLVNEPISWGANDPTKTQEWSKTAFDVVKGASKGNPNLNVIMHDAFQTAWAWADTAWTRNGPGPLSNSKYWIDTHLYQNQVAEDSQLNQDQHIEKACKWSTTHLLWKDWNLPVIVGEFSAQTNICANPDGSTVAGSVCTVDTCQCSSNVDVQYWQPHLVDATRKFLEAELDTFEEYSRGWFIWSYKGPGAWGLANIMKYGVLGRSVTERKFPGQCAKYWG